MNQDQELAVLSAAMDYERRFGGIGRLYGLDALERFRAAHVCVIGIGGVGSWAVEALARSAIGHISLIDLDNVAESNINRQLHATDQTLGRAKVAVMADRIQSINSHCAVSVIEESVDDSNLVALLPVGFDFVIDCIDDFRTKAALIAHCRRLKMRLITIGGSGGQSDPTRIRVADLSRAYHDRLLARVRKLLRADFGFPTNPKRRFEVPCVFSEEQPVFPTSDGGVCRRKPEDAAASGLSCAGGLGSVMTVTASFGLIAVAHVLRKLADSPPRAGQQSDLDD